MRKKLLLTGVVAALTATLVYAANPQLGFTELVANQSQPHVVVNAADRAITQAFAGQVTINFASDANLTLSTTQWKYGTIRLTDTAPVLTTGRDVVYPDADTQVGGTSRMTFIVENATAQTLTVKRSGQTGVAIPAMTSVLVHHNGADIVSVAAGGGGGGGGAPDDATYITQTPDGDLSNEQALSALSSGIMRVATTTGVITSLGDTLPVANGGTNLTGATDDNLMVGNGTTWQSKAVPDCDDTGGNHLNYDTGTNVFSCGTSGGGGGGTPGGSDTQVQYNDGGAFGGDSAFLWNESSNILTLGNGNDTATIQGNALALNRGSHLTVRAGAGVGTNEQGGSLALQGGAAGSGATTGGVSISTPDASGNAASGGISITTGSGGTTGSPASGGISLTVGDAGFDNGAAGNIVINGGRRYADTLGTAGDIRIFADNAQRLEVDGTTHYTMVQRGNVTLASSSGGAARVGGVVYVNTTQTGNAAATETDAFSHSVTAATLNANGEALEFEAAGTIAGTANTDKRIKVVWGGTTCLDTGSMAITSAASWRVVGSVVRTGATTQKCSATLTTSDAGVPVKVGYSTAAETLSGAVTMKLTTNGTGASDVVAEYYREKWMPAQ